MKSSLFPLVVLLVALSGCRKDDVDIEQLTTNPFDADYNGAAMFEAIDTYLVTEDIPGSGTLTRQAIRFRVRIEQFLPEQSGRPFQVFVRDITAGGTFYLEPGVPGDDEFTYLRYDVSPGIPVCLELALANNFSAARPETICVTL
jgi:hypothetical protein